MKGTLYGTTTDGGANGERGTVFSITTSGTEKVLHSFGKRNRWQLSQRRPDRRKWHALRHDDWWRRAWRRYGLQHHDGRHGEGAAQLRQAEPTASIPRRPDRRKWHALRHDGWWRRVYLRRSTCGTVFSITTGGTEKVLHSFGKGTDGSNPYAGLIDVNGTLYGTTVYGGAYDYYGTVFSLKP